MKKTISILKSKVVIFLFLCLFLMPHFLVELDPTVRTVVYVFNVVISLVSIIAYVFNGKINKIFIPLCLYYAVLFVSTILNESGIIYFLYQALVVFGFISYIDLVFTDKKTGALNVFLLFFTIVNMINFISVIMNPNRAINMSSYRIYFLGYDNDLNLILTMSCYVLLLFHHKLREKKTKNYNVARPLFYANYIICILSAFLVQSVTIKVCMMMFVFCYIFIFVLGFLPKKVFNYGVYIIISFLLSILLILPSSQSYFSGISNSMNRDATFTGRTEIWSSTLDIVEEHKFLGIGHMNMGRRLQEYGIYHAHSTYLNVLLESGIVGEILYLFFFIFVGFLISKIKEGKAKSIASFAIFTYLIMTLFEVYVDILYFYLLLTIVVGSSASNKMIIYRRRVDEKNIISE